MTINKPPKIPRLPIAIAVIIALLTGLPLGTMLTSAGDYPIPDYQAGQNSAAAIKNANANIVIATVGPKDITLAQFTEDRQHFLYTKDISQRELDGIIDRGLPLEYLQARQDLANLWGDDNVIVAGLVMDEVMHQKAVALGISVTDDEIKEIIELTRKVFDNGEVDPYNKGYAESLGMERYWSEYPEKVERGLLYTKLRQHVASENGSFAHDDAILAWQKFAEETLAEADADIQLHDSNHHSATLENALDYLASLRELERSHIQQKENQPRAPADKWVVYTKPENGPLTTAHFDIEPTYCHEPDTDTHWVCDAQSKERLIELYSGDLYLIVAPGAILPVFTENP